MDSCHRANSFCLLLVTASLILLSCSLLAAPHAAEAKRLATRSDSSKQGKSVMLGLRRRVIKSKKSSSSKKSKKSPSKSSKSPSISGTKKKPGGQPPAPVGPALCVMQDNNFKIGVTFQRMAIADYNPLDTLNPLPYTYVPPKGRLALTSDCTYVVDSTCKIIQTRQTGICDDSKECTIDSCQYPDSPDVFYATAGACSSSNCPLVGGFCSNVPLVEASCGRNKICNTEGECVNSVIILSPSPSPPPPAFAPPPKPPSSANVHGSGPCRGKADGASCTGSSNCTTSDCRCYNGNCLAFCSMSDNDGEACQCAVASPDGCFCRVKSCKPFCKIVANRDAFCQDCSSPDIGCSCSASGLCLPLV